MQAGLKEDADVCYEVQEGEQLGILGVKVTETPDRLEVTIL